MTESVNILFMTDKFKISPGYEPAFARMVGRVKLPRNRIIVTDIYASVNQPLVKKGNEKLWRVNLEQLPAIKAAFDQRIKVVRPRVIVVACPAVLGVLVNGDQSIATIEKCRGGVYYYDGIPCIVTYPITAIHQQIDERLLKDNDGNDVAEEPYRVPNGAWVMMRDWEKVSRYYHGTQRKLPPFEYGVIRTVEDMKAAKEFLTSCVAIAIDIETGCYPPQITAIGYYGIDAKGRTRGYVFPFYDPRKPDGCFYEEWLHEVAYDFVNEINQSPVMKVMQNGSYDCSYFIRDRLAPINWVLDSMYLWYSIYMELPRRLDFITSVLLDNYQYWKDDIKGVEDKDQTGNGMETYWRYCALDCYNTLFNAMSLCVAMAASPSVQTNYNDTMMRVFSSLAMSMAGTKVDRGRMAYHRDKLTEQRDRLVERFRYIVDDDEFNINSPAQKNEFFYQLLGARMRNARGRFIDPAKPMKGTNAPSTGAIALKMIKAEHPLFELFTDALAEAQEPDKQLSLLFGNEQPDGKISGGLFIPTGRLRTSFSAVGTETTRLASRKSAFWDGGNVQNMRKEFRDFCVADDGCVLMEVDFSQSDDVFVSYESEDPEKIKLVESGMDGHAVHGELFFKTPYDKIVAGKKAGDPIIVHPIKGIRQISKRVVHGTNFQMAALTLYITMGRDSVVAAAELLGFADAMFWPQDKLVNLCGQLMAAYRRRYKRLNKDGWYADIVKELRDNGAMVNAFGIRRIFMGDWKDNGTQREATAFIGQGDTAGNMNRALNEVNLGFMPRHFRDGPNMDWGDQPRMMTWDSHGIRFLKQVHDSFLVSLNLRNPKWMEAATNLLHVMERPVTIKGRQVRVKTEAEFSLAWGSKLGSIEWKHTKPDALDQLEAIALTLTDNRVKGLIQ